MTAGLVVLMVVNAFVQTVGIASVMPFLSVLGDPSVVHEHRWLSAAYEVLPFETARSFLFFLGGAAFALIVIGNAVQAATKWTETRFTHMRRYSVSCRLMADYLRRPYTFYLNRNSADLSKSILEETNHAIRGGLMPLLKLLSNGILALAILGLLLLVEPWLTLLAASVLGLTYGVIYLVARVWLARIGAERVSANEKRFAAVGEAFAGAKEIRLLGRERPYLERYKGAAHQFARHQANSQILENLPQYAIEAIAFGGVLLLVLYLMADGGGVAQALPIIGLYALAVKRLIPAFQSLFGAFAQLRFNMPAVETLLKDLNDRSEVVPLVHQRRQPEPMVPRQAIELDQVSFRYPGAEMHAVQQLSLAIPANTTVGIVGPSGAGKSTVVDLLLGLLAPDSGEMRVDGVTLRQQTLRDWQAGIGYVPQHIFLADDTVRGNIALGLKASEIDELAVERAARLANLDGFVRTQLPSGYDTPIGERGVRLSGGQRQRIGIARALYRDPAVLIFDEATSALDTATEKSVMSAVHNLAGQKTIILIAHRLTTVKNCDRLFVLEQGRLVEEGSWDDLIAQDGRLTQLAAGMA
nr:ABC transporter ATP-binding protein [Halorhodospira halophila]